MLSIDELFVLFGFIAVVLALEGGYLVWHNNHGAEPQRLRRRLHSLQADEYAAVSARLSKQQRLEASGPLRRLLAHLPGRASLEQLLVQSGSSQTIAEVMLHSLAAAAVAVLVVRLLHLPLWLIAGGGLAASTLPLLRLLALRRKRLRRIDEQLPDALDLMGRALRAGHAFSAALGMVGSESSEPIAGEFRTTFEEINFGIPQSEALINLGKRVPSPDLGYFIIGVLLQRETGGNLSELLGNLSGLIRARFKLLGTIRALSAEGRMSAWVLALLPFVVAAVINTVNPKLMSVLWTEPAGLKLVYAALGLMLIGIVWMWRLVKVRI